MSQEWCTIESDPGLFTELIADFGAKDVQVDEMFSMDQAVTKSYGLIFLFKWRQETDTRSIIPAANLPELFFARQVIF
jgi:ubiquitin carboxyl-terminal hydrolase L5